MKNAFYSNTIRNFIVDDPRTIKGELADEHTDMFDLKGTQNFAWTTEIDLLKSILSSVELQQCIDADDRILFEYTIPRIGSRIDVVLLIKGLVFLLEFKAGSREFISQDKLQAYYYAIDLKCFQRASRDRILVPMLVATEARIEKEELQIGENGILSLVKSDKENLASIIMSVIDKYSSQASSTAGWQKDWENSWYEPTPTIIEAASNLYINHTVSDIHSSESSYENLSKTSKFIKGIIDKVSADHSNSNNQGTPRRAICFVTGVPGAGKTLVGLDVVNYVKEVKGGQSVFLTGNQPLQKVLSTALVEDKYRQECLTNKKYTKEEAKTALKSSIQMIHSYRDETLKQLVDVDPHINPDPSAWDNKNIVLPQVEHVAVFDESQRAWTNTSLFKFLTGKDKIKKDLNKDWNFSEAAFLIGSMNLRKDWAIIVCLVGGGQEINQGEAGIIEWIKAIRDYYHDWDVYLSDQLFNDPNYNGLDGKESLADIVLEINQQYTGNQPQCVTITKELHLSTAIRSLRASQVSSFVADIINNNPQQAKQTIAEIKANNYPIKLTRSVEKAKAWLRSRSENVDIRTWFYSHCELEEIRNKISLNGTPEDLESLISQLSSISVDATISQSGKDEAKALLSALPKEMRIGLVASSNAGRLKALGMEVKNEKEVDVAKWFLAPTNDVRSSSFLEEVVSEFVVQGLEIDYAGIVWDADFRYTKDNEWSHYAFKGTTWTNINDDYKIAYQTNAYRVLLTRARMGMVIVVPEGVTIDGASRYQDQTRNKEYYDYTYDYLLSILGEDSLL